MLAQAKEVLAFDRGGWVFAIVALASLVLLTCGGGDHQVYELPDELESPPDTTVGPGDVFEVRVYGEEELSGDYRVASDGTIDFPLVGLLQVQGKTPSEIGALVEQALRDGDFLKKPEISVLVTEYASKKVSVFGQVKKPGTFPYRDGMTVVEAISGAGGFTAMARENDTFVIRIVDGEKRRFTVPVEAIGQGQAKNFILRTGDIVFVPERIF